MTDKLCGYSGEREETLVAYLYDDIDSAQRALFESHLLACARCREDLSGLRGVRSRIAQWSPPSPAFAISGQQSAISNRHRWWFEIPAWAQVAAALLFLGVAAGIANLDVHYDHSGLTVRTGWSSPGAATAVAQNGAAPAWRADLTALEQRLRTEFHATDIAATGRAATASDSDTLRRVRTLVDESERRQERELALRLAGVMRDVEAQRQSDLVKIDRSLGVIQNNAGVEVMKQRELLNYLVRASQRQ